MNYDTVTANSPVTDLSRRLLWPAVLICCLVKVWLTWGRYLNQDEFETLHQAWLTFDGTVPYRDFHSNHPPLGFFWLSGLNALTDDAVTLIRLARGLTLITAGLVLWLVYRIARDVFGAEAARWTVIVYAVNAMFWEWSTEIRTDFIAIPLWLAAVSFLFSPRPRSTVCRMVAIGLLMGAAFWVNQKVVFHAAPIAVLMLLRGPDRSWRLTHVLWAIAASLVPTTWVLASAWANGSLHELIDQNFFGGNAWGIVKTDHYGKWRSWTLHCAVRDDAGFVLLSLAACVWASGSGRSRSQFFICASAMWMLLTLFFTPGPFSYYLLGVYPLFAIAIGGLLASLSAKVRTQSAKRRWYRPLVALAIVFYALFPLWRMTRFIWPTNRYQLAVLRVATQLAPPGTRVFDGAGTMVTRPDAFPFHWVLWHSELRAYREGKLPPLLPALRENDCRLLIDTYRVRGLTADDKRDLQTHFVRLWGPLCVPGFDSLEPIGQEPQEFELWYEGLYRADRSDAVVDGELMNGPRRLAAGPHTLSLRSGSARVRLYKLDGVDVESLPADRNDPIEFLDYYGYGY
jgi:4-amino-4-deoxy-L-arabinose transferase-like glycosyltransferase